MITRIAHTNLHYFRMLCTISSSFKIIIKFTIENKQLNLNKLLNFLWKIAITVEIYISVLKIIENQRNAVDGKEKEENTSDRAICVLGVT